MFTKKIKHCFGNFNQSLFCKIVFWAASYLPRRYKPMKREEKIAEKYLEKLGLGFPNYEPDGNIPPDFSIGTIGIEVRRLNQNYFNENETEGIEQKQYLIYKVLEDILRSFDSLYSGKSYWVGIHYQRPLPKSKELKKIIKSALQEFLDNNLPTPFTLKIADRIEIRLFSTNKSFSKLFMIGSSADFDSGGFVNSIFIENISYCISEKTNKILKYKNMYETWWLVLVNEIGINLNDIDDINEIKSFIQSKGDFEKVIIIDSKSSKLIFEI